MTSKEYPDFIETTGYGTGEGLCGWNCRHGFSPFFEGMKNPYTDENGNLKIDSEENRKVYEATQKQRAMERAIRKTKRQLIAKNEQLCGEDSEKRQAEYDRLSYKLVQQNGRYNKFCDENNLQPQYERNKLADFNRAQEKQANTAAKRYKKSIEQ
jgi:hypothetical protein